MFCRSTDGNSEKFGGSIAFRVKHIKGRLARTASAQVMFNAERRVPHRVCSKAREKAKRREARKKLKTFCRRSNVKFTHRSDKTPFAEPRL